MYLAEALPPVAPVTTAAVAALFALCALVVCIGIVKSLDAISRAFFGTVSGAVGWLPFAGRVAKHSLHKIEQKISHILGTAERKLEGGVAYTWDHCAHLVAWLGAEIESGARTAWHLAQQAKAFVRHREVTHEIKSSVAPIKARQTDMRHDLHNLSSEQAALKTSVAQGVYPRIKTIEHDVTTIIVRDIPRAKADARAAEDLAITTYKWITKHKTTFLTGVFTGAAAWALTRLGGGWIRCGNWRRIGKAVCRMPYSTITAFLGLLATVWGIAHIRTVATYAEAISEEVARDLLKVAGVADPPRDRFTIE